MHEQFPYNHVPGTASPINPRLYSAQAVSRPTPHDLYKMIQRLNERLNIVEERISRLENRIHLVDGNFSLSGEAINPENL